MIRYFFNIFVLAFAWSAMVMNIVAGDFQTAGVFAALAFLAGFNAFVELKLR